MKSFKTLSKREMLQTQGGTRTVSFEDWDGDGIIDKIVTVTRGGSVVRRKVIYGTAAQ